MGGMGGQACEHEPQASMCVPLEGYDCSAAFGEYAYACDGAAPWDTCEAGTSPSPVTNWNAYCCPAQCVRAESADDGWCPACTDGYVCHGNNPDIGWDPSCTPGNGGIANVVCCPN